MKWVIVWPQNGLSPDLDAGGEGGRSKGVWNLDGKGKVPRKYSRLGFGDGSISIWLFKGHMVINLEVYRSLRDGI